MNAYRTPDQTAAECQRQADRFDRQCQPNNAAAYRTAAVESQILAVNIAAVLSVEREKS